MTTFYNYSLLNGEQITNQGKDSVEILPFDWDISGKFCKAFEIFEDGVFTC